MCLGDYVVQQYCIYNFVSTALNFFSAVFPSLELCLHTFINNVFTFASTVFHVFSTECSFMNTVFAFVSNVFTLLSTVLTFIKMLCLPSSGG